MVMFIMYQSIQREGSGLCGSKDTSQETEKTKLQHEHR